MLLAGALDKRGWLNPTWRSRRFVLRADGILEYHACADSDVAVGQEVQLRELRMPARQRWGAIATRRSLGGDSDSLPGSEARRGPRARRALPLRD